EAVATAQSIAIRNGNQQVDIEHLLAAMLEQERGLAPAILNKAGFDVDAIRTRVAQEIQRLPKVSGSTPAGQIYITNRMNQLFTKAEDEAKAFKDEYISIEHFLLAITDDKGAAGRLFKDFAVTRDRLMQALQEIRGNQRITSQNPEATYE